MVDASIIGIDQAIGQDNNEDNRDRVKFGAKIFISCQWYHIT